LKREKVDERCYLTINLQTQWALLIKWLEWRRKTISQ